VAKDVTYKMASQAFDQKYFLPNGQFYNDLCQKDSNTKNANCSVKIISSNLVLTTIESYVKAAIIIRIVIITDWKRKIDAFLLLSYLARFCRDNVFDSLIFAANHTLFRPMSNSDHSLNSV
jgi:ABC-type polysaccharide/polyol phosphate export permease